jgi:hypothetical protein
MQRQADLCALLTEATSFLAGALQDKPPVAERTWTSACACRKGLCQIRAKKAHYSWNVDQR